jgi:hypothetical protein
MRTKITEWQHPWIPRLAACLALIGSGCTTPWGKLGAVGEEDGGTTDEADPTLGESGETGDGGQTSGAETSGAETSGSETGDEPPMSCELDVGASFPRAMVRTQYENTVADVLAVPAASWSTDVLWEDLPSDQHAGPFDAMPLDQGEPAVAGAYQAMASAVAVALDPASLLPCDPATPDPEACAEELVTALGRQVWRRPLEPAEVEALLQAYEGTDLVEGTREVVEALLTSPNMWILQETGTAWAADAGVIVLDSWSMATRMAYFLWGSTPDAELLAQAEAGALSDPLVRADEAERMLADPRAERMLGQLYGDWLDVELGATEKDPALFPEYGPSLAAAMEQELRLFVTDVVLGSDPRIHTLLNAPFTYVDAQLLALYGSDVAGDPGALAPGEFVRVDLDPAHRGGVLTLPAVMTQHSGYASLPWSPRGLLVRQNLMCNSIPPPPPDVDVTPLDESEGRYAAWAMMLEEPSCVGCHQLFNPLTFAFDEYDPVGRWQNEIAGEPVQTAWELESVTSGSMAFAGRAELTQILPTLPEVSECAAWQHLRFALRRELDEQDLCAVEELTEQVEATDGDLRALLSSVVVAEHFGLVRPQ